MLGMRLIVIHHVWHPPASPIQPGIVPLLMVLRVHDGTAIAQASGLAVVGLSIGELHCVPIEAGCGRWWRFDVVGFARAGVGYHLLVN